MSSHHLKGIYLRGHERLRTFLEEASWIRSAPCRSLPPEVVERLVHTAFPRGRVLEIQPLTDGLRNSNFRIRLNCASEWIVLRIYEHHESLCQKELDLIRLLGGSVPVPEVIH